MDSSLATKSVAIILPAYNAEKTLGKTVQSIINQSYKNWRLYIVDDGSIDNTKNLIASFTKSDCRISAVILDKNGGVDNARRKAFDIIEKCDYVAFCDSDDLWLPKKLELQIEFLEKNHIAFCCTAESIINSDYKELGIKIVPPKCFCYSELLKVNPINNSSVLLTYELATSVSYPIEGGTEDYEYWLSILRKNNCSAYGMDTVLTKRMRRKESVSSNKLKAVKRNWFVYRHYEKLGIIQSVFLIVNYAFIKIFRVRETKYILEYDQE
ncbi:MAG: glycosyltransferase family A protein [Sphaerochaetaceae bacterium]|nr:glycosyltransferase family A protein [Sphaerochaetaceae bacterium]